MDLLFIAKSTLEARLVELGTCSQHFFGRIDILSAFWTFERLCWSERHVVCGPFGLLREPASTNETTADESRAQSGPSGLSAVCFLLDVPVLLPAVDYHSSLFLFRAARPALLPAS